MEPTNDKQQLETFDFPPSAMFVKSRILSECQTDWILMRRRVARRLIWIQSVRIGNHKVTSRVLKEVKSADNAELGTLPSPRETLGTVADNFFGETDKIPFAITYGDTNQYQFSGPFSGNQCTSMCLAAIAWWIIKGDTGSFSSEDVSLVLRCGHDLHTALRIDHNLSKNEDGRIAIDDLPPELSTDLFGSSTLLTRASDDWFVLTSPREDAAAFSTLQGYLQSRLELNNHGPEGYLLTIGQMSNALLFTRQGRWLWFDSHGLMNVSGTRCRNLGAVVELETLDNLAMFVIALRKPGEITQILPIACVPVAEEEPVCPSSGVPSPPVATQSEDEDRRLTDTTDDKCNSLTEADTPPVGQCSSIDACKRSADLSFCDDETDDESPYIALMGGFGFD